MKNSRILGENFGGKYQKNRFVGPAERTVFSIGIDCFCFWDLISFLECVCVLSNRKKNEPFHWCRFFGGPVEIRKMSPTEWKIIEYKLVRIEKSIL